MQIWICFNAGAGGDSVSNLLEHASEISPIDQNSARWRLSHYIDNLATFWAPPFDDDACFRNSQGPRPFDKKTNQLSTRYLEIINQNLNTVCTSHDVTLQALENSDCQDILSKNIIKVLVKHQDPIKSNFLSKLKNFHIGSLSADPNWLRSIKLIDETKFNYVIDIDQFTQDWIYVDGFCQSVGLTLPQSTYQYWQKLLYKESSALAHTVKSYRSHIEHDQILSYTEI